MIKNDLKIFESVICFSVNLKAFSLKNQADFIQSIDLKRNLILNLYNINKAQRFHLQKKKLFTTSHKHYFYFKFYLQKKNFIYKKLHKLTEHFQLN